MHMFEHWHPCQASKLTSNGRTQFTCHVHNHQQHVHEAFKVTSVGQSTLHAHVASQHVYIASICTHVRPLSSTRIGSLPCSSASMSEGLQEWKAPLQINRMWSVFTLPCLVCTTEPSMMGSKSLCTPSELASAPAATKPRCSAPCSV